MRRLAAAVAVGAMTICSAAEARLPSKGWLPASMWTVQKRHICTAYKIYRNGKTDMLALIKPSPTSGAVRIDFEVPSEIHVYGLTLASASIGKERAQDIKTMAVAPSTNKGRLIYSLWLDRPALDRPGAGERLTFNTRSLGLDLAIPDAARALDKIRPCTAEILEQCGLSRESQARLVRFAVPMARTTPAGYPDEAQKKGALGDVEGRVTIGSDGRARDCRILVSSGHESLDELSCRTMLSSVFPRLRRARECRSPRPISSSPATGFSFGGAKRADTACGPRAVTA